MQSTRRLAITVMTLCVYSYATAPRSGVEAAPVPMQQGFTDTLVFSGLNAPTAVRFSPDGRVFVAEKSGIIKVFDSLSDTQPTIFADLRTNVHNFWDRGLLGLELDPGFPTRPYVYVLYTFDGPIGGTAPRWGLAGQTSDGCPDPPGATASGCDVSGRLSRLQAAGNVMTGSEHVLVHDWFQQFGSHGMGALAFGADGALYVSAGDGASYQFVDYGQNGNPGGDPPVVVGGVQTTPSAEGGALRSQDVRTSGDPTGLSGTIIRVDPNTGAALSNNPWAGSANANTRRIVAYGFRNPFRMTVRPATREVWVGDVGWRDWEEINVVADTLSATVRNFGWPCYEGRVRQPGYDAADLTLCESLYAQSGAVTLPHFQYKEGVALVSGESCPSTDSATTGLAFYRGGDYPSRYDGALFFGDYARHCIWVMFPGVDGLPDPATRAVFITNAGGPVDLQIGPGGDLFYVDILGGTVRRVRYSSDNTPPIAEVSATPVSGSAPLTVTFDGRASSDAEDSVLRFEWDLNGDGAFGDASGSTAAYTYSTNGTFTATLRVTDSGGLSDTDSVAINVGTTAPVATIAAPASTLRWRVGETVTFSGSATDREQGTLPASALKWALIMNHCSSSTSCHEHVIREFAGVSSGAFVAPDHDVPSFLTLRLTATDQGGLEHTTARRLDPLTVLLTFQTSPPGLQLGVGSGTIVTPSTLPFIVGSTISVSAPAPQVVASFSHNYVSWSDGGAQTHNIVAGSSPVTYLATYTAPSSVGREAVMYASRAPVRRGAWTVVSDPTAAGGARLEHPDAGAAKLTTPLASPANYFELQFQADAGRPYHLWLRGRARGDSYLNDSVFVQFSDTITTSGSAAYRIGTTSAIPLVLEECGGCALSAWGWRDSGYGRDVLGPAIYFAKTGTQTIRIQGREDGTSIDQVVLSSGDYLNKAPGVARQDTTILPERPGTADMDVVRHAAAASVIAGTWRRVADMTAASGIRLEHPNVDAPKAAPSATPRDYFEVVFTAVAGEPYRLWLRGRAAGNSYYNDSVYVQFSGSIDAAGVPVYRIGSTSAASVILEECAGCALSGWGWQDNGYGAAGALIYFATSGPQTLRIQGREDGVSIDQVVLSRGTYLVQAPGAPRADSTILK